MGELDIGFSHTRQALTTARGIVSRRCAVDERKSDRWKAWPLDFGELTVTEEVGRLRLMVNFLRFIIERV